MSNKINSKTLTQFKVSNFFNHADLADVIPFSEDYEISRERLGRIAALCNQPDIYNILFKEKLGGKKYSLSDAEKFYKWACEGWAKQMYFVYIIINNNGEIIGAIDIKSDNPEGAEIGYWLDENSHGFMTNTVLALAEKAEVAGYKTLYALVNLENMKSGTVLKRAGFVEIGQVLKKGKTFNKFVIELSL